MSIKNKSAIVGIGQTAYSKSLGKSELSVAIECCKKAIEDAGMTSKDIDGIVRFDMDATHEDELVYALGIKELHFFAGTPYGGGAGANSVQLAAMAIATGQAENVVCFRSRNRGKSSAAGAGRPSGGRPWENQYELEAYREEARVYRELLAQGYAPGQWEPLGVSVGFA